MRSASLCLTLIDRQNSWVFDGAWEKSYGRRLESLTEGTFAPNKVCLFMTWKSFEFTIIVLQFYTFTLGGKPIVFMCSLPR